MGNNQSRYHAEVKLARKNGDNEVRVNIFADTLAEIFADIAEVEAQFSREPRAMSQAQLEMARAEQLAQAAKSPAKTPIADLKDFFKPEPKPAPKPPAKPAPRAEKPVCPKHGLSAPSKFGGLYCPTRDEFGEWCTWKSD